MTRARLVLLLGAAAAAGCGGKSSAPSRGNFRLPSSVAFFMGRTVDATVRPYFAVANEARDDLSLVNATDDVVLDAPVLLRPLAVPFPDRPAQLASAPLGDGTPDAPTPDLLVGVAAGDSRLQLVRTWLLSNDVDPAQEVDLGADVLGIVALPPGTGEPPNTVRLAVSLAGRKLALVRYTRAPAGDAVEVDGSYGVGGVLVHGLDFEPADLATVPGDGDHLYAATLDPIGAGAVHGVAELDLLAPAEPWTVRALDARGPTRLVAAAMLRERLPGSVAKDETAFDTTQPPVPRIYAVLDESGCGVGARIDCGIVVLDPAKAPAAGDDNIPDDWAAWMPYRAPIHPRSRPLAIAVSGAPAKDPPDAVYTPGLGFMRLVLGTYATVATTAVGMVAEEGGLIDFLDLGRFKAASTTNAPQSAGAFVTAPTTANRLWIQDPATGSFAETNTAAADLIHVTPGYAQDETWTVTYQGALPGLTFRSAEAGYNQADPARPWLAVQFGDGTPGDPARSPSQLSQVVRLYHPAVGVRVGDIVMIKVDSFKINGVDACEGLPPPGTAQDLIPTTPKEFETKVAQLLPPSDAYPGGAVALELRSKAPRELNPLDPKDVANPPEWQACWTAFAGALANQGSALKGLVVTFFAGDPDDTGQLLLTGGQIGYAGRPVAGTEYVLRYKADPSEPGLFPWQYQDEDALAASCPLADWDGSWPTATDLYCGGAGCDRVPCEGLVLARKARRRYHLAEDCEGNAECIARYPLTTFPAANGPALSVQVGYDGDPGAQWVRGALTLKFSTHSGVTPLNVSAGGATSNASGAMAFDRSPYVPAAGYRFLVTYPGNQVADVSPSVTPVSSNTIR